MKILLYINLKQQVREQAGRKLWKLTPWRKIFRTILMSRSTVAKKDLPVSCFLTGTGTSSSTRVNTVTNKAALILIGIWYYRTFNLQKQFYIKYIAFYGVVQANLSTNLLWKRLIHSQSLLYLISKALGVRKKGTQQWTNFFSKECLLHFRFLRFFLKKRYADPRVYFSLITLPSKQNTRHDRHCQQTKEREPEMGKERGRSVALN